MKFGVAVSNMHKGLVERLNPLNDIIVKAEELGYDSFLVTDHYMLPWGSNETLETWAYLSYLAGKATNIRLGTCVTPIPFRPPSQLAKTISTLDLISNGRVIVGVGLGWYEDEFEAYSSWDPLHVRFEKTKEALQLMVKLWCKDKIDFKGTYYRVKGAVLKPKPIQKPHPSLWFGGKGKKMLELTAEMGNGWITWGPRWAPIYTTVEEYKRCVETIKRLRESFGKKEKFTFACMLSPHESFEELARDIEAYQKVGMDYLLLGLSRNKHISDGLHLVRRFKNEIFPSFS